MKLWIVSMKDSSPVFLSVHSTEEKAREAIVEYTKDGNWGSKETDYRIDSQLLDHVIV